MSELSPALGSPAVACGPGENAPALGGAGASPVITLIGPREFYRRYDDSKEWPRVVTHNGQEYQWCSAGWCKTPEAFEFNLYEAKRIFPHHEVPEGTYEGPGYYVEYRRVASSGCFQCKACKKYEARDKRDRFECQSCGHVEWLPLKRMNCFNCRRDYEGRTWYNPSSCPHCRKSFVD